MEGVKRCYHCTNEPDEVVFEKLPLHAGEFSMPYFVAFFSPFLLEEFEVR